MAVEEIAAKEVVDVATKATQGTGNEWDQDYNLDDIAKSDAGRKADVDFMRGALESSDPAAVNFTDEFAKFSTEFSKFSSEVAKANERAMSKWERPDFVSRVKEQLERVVTLAEELTNNPDVGQADLIRLQYEVMQMAVVLDVASKVGDKSSQAIQSMFRNQ
jgi:hypothetical protein